MDLGLAGRAAIVTGASRGIGRSVALQLLAEGCRVLLVGRDRDALAAVHAEAGDDTAPLACDVTEPASADLMVDECRRVFGRLDVVVNNAGRAEPKALVDLTPADWQRTCRTCPGSGQGELIPVEEITRRMKVIRL